MPMSKRTAIFNFIQFSPTSIDTLKFQNCCCKSSQRSTLGSFVDLSVVKKQNTDNLNVAMPWNQIGPVVRIKRAQQGTVAMQDPPQLLPLRPALALLNVDATPNNTNRYVDIK